MTKSDIIYWDLYNTRKQIAELEKHEEDLRQKILREWEPSGAKSDSRLFGNLRVTIGRRASRSFGLQEIKGAIAETGNPALMPMIVKATESVDAKALDKAVKEKLLPQAVLMLAKEVPGAQYIKVEEVQ